MFSHHRANNPYWMALWVRLIGEATHQPIKAVFEGNEIELLPGQLITGRKKLALLVGCSESEIEFLLKAMELGQQIRQQKKAHSRLISIENYDKYQTIDREIDNKKTTNRQPIDTKQEQKKLRSKEVKINIKDKYLDFVHLSPEEYSKLEIEYGKTQTADLIKRLNDYIGSKGDKYKSHYFTLLNFARRDNIKKIDKPKDRPLDNTPIPVVYSIEEEKERTRKMHEELAKAGIRVGNQIKVEEAKK